MARLVEKTVTNLLKTLYMSNNYTLLLVQLIASLIKRQNTPANMDRRKAIKSAAALTLGAALISALKPQKINGKLGVALVGLGNYATNQLRPALEKTEHCYLAGIVTGTPQKAIDWSAQCNIPQKNIYNYETFDRIKDNPDIDIVYIVLPNFMHAEYTIRALQAGKHVICEKPMGMNSRECKEMIAAAKKAGKLLQVGYRLYHEPHHLAAHSTGTTKKWGNAVVMESSLGFRMAIPGIWRLDKDKGGGGAIMDLGVYCIQAARRFTGTLPVSVLAQGYNTNPELFRGIYETVTFQLQFPAGAICNATTSYSAYVDRFHAACEKGWLTLKPSFNAGQKVVINASEDIPVKHPVRQYQQIAQMDAFAGNIKNNSPVAASGEEGLIDLQIIEAIKKSIETGRRTSIDYS